MPGSGCRRGCAVAESQWRTPADAIRPRALTPRTRRPPPPVAARLGGADLAVATAAVLRHRRRPARGHHDSLPGARASTPPSHVRPSPRASATSTSTTTAGHAGTPATSRSRWRARRKHGPDAVTFETSGYYLFHPLAPERIARDLPDVRVVVMVREPVERAYSAHRHELARGFETEEFEQAVALEEERIAGRWSGSSPTRRTRASSTVTMPIWRGAATASRSSASSTPLVPTVSTSSTPTRSSSTPMPSSTGYVPGSVFRNGSRRRSSSGTPARDPDGAALRERLEHHFEPYDARLAEQMGRTPSWRASSAGNED